MLEILISICCHRTIQAQTDASIGLIFMLRDFIVST